MNFEIKKERNLLETKIETERLLLVPISMDFKDEIFKEFTSEITIFMYPSPAKEISETEKFIEESLNGLRENSNLQLVALDKNTKEFFGCVGLHKVNTKIPEMGIWLKKSAHGKGYGKEMIKAIKDWADENLTYDFILYPVDKDNIASRKIPEFLGGKIEKEYDLKTPDGRILHSVEYRIYPN